MHYFTVIKSVHCLHTPIRIVLIGANNVAFVLRPISGEIIIRRLVIVLQIKQRGNIKCLNVIFDMFDAVANQSTAARENYL